MKISITFAVLLTASCKEKKSVPEDIIGKEEMAKILIDIHLTEGKVETLNIISQDTSRVLYVRLEEDIFKKHKISKEKFLESRDWYLHHLEFFNEIYTTVKDSLAAKEARGEVD